MFAFMKSAPVRVLLVSSLLISGTITTFSLGVGQIGLAAAGPAALAVPVGQPAPVMPSTSLVISQVYGGGGSASATTYCHDFIELFNPTAAPFTTNNWSVQYASSANNFSGIYNLPNVTIPAGGYYLIQTGSQTTGTCAPLPTPDAIASLNLSATNGKVALVNNQTLLACGATGNRCTTNPQYSPFIVDFVGYGTASDYEGAGPVGALTNTSSAERNGQGCVDTDNNIADFTIRTEPAITPRNSASPLNVCTPGATPTATVLVSPTATRTPGGPTDTPTVTRTATATVGSSVRIYQIQGAQHRSPRLGQAVSNVPGIVTVLRTNGFYMQDPMTDSDPATSEALFVFTSANPSGVVSVGHSVLVSGTVSEFRPGGAGGTNNLSTTQITTNLSSVVVVSSGNALPTPVVIGNGGRIPPTDIIEDQACGDVELGGCAFDPATDGLDFYESLEAMRVQVNNAVAVGPTNNFGEIPVLGDDGANASVRTSRGGIIIRPTDFNPERIILDDTLMTVPDVSVGDHFTTPAIGVMDYSFANFKLYITQALTAVPGGLAREVATPAGVNQIAVGNFNVENLDPTDPQSKFDALADIIINNLASPDILSVEEIQDNNGPVNDGEVNADITYNMLIAAIQARGGPLYQYRQVNPVDDQDGGEPGGNIRQGFLFRTDRGVQFVDRPGGCSTCDTTVVGGAGGPELSFSPGRVRPTATAFVNSRKPLAGEFVYTSNNMTNKLFLVGNHLNSKGGDQPLFGRFQPPTRSSEVQRHQQAQIIHDFVDQILALDANANVIVLGDINDFYFSTTINIIEGDAARAGSSGLARALTNLIETLPLPERYTYVFDGNSQDLDNTLVSGNILNNTAPQFDVIHVNSEFADQVSDHDPQVSRLYFGPALTPTATPIPTATPCTIMFSDVPVNHTFYPFIRCLACRGIVSGYADGTFKPGNEITRGQIAKMVSNAAGFSEDPGLQIYEDVNASNTFYVWINRLSRRGHMGGYACGTVPEEPCVLPQNRPYFRPYSNATRGQLAKIVSNAAGIQTTPSGVFYTDVQEDNPFYVWIMRLTERGVMSGYECGGVGEPCDPQNRPYFRPFNNVTRGQASKIVANTFYPGCVTPQR